MSRAPQQISQEFSMEELLLHALVIELEAVPMRTLAESLSAFAFNKPVVDESGLAGKYDFRLRYVPGDRESRQGSGRRALNAGRSDG